MNVDLIDALKVVLGVVGVYLTVRGSLRIAKMGDKTNRQANTEANSLTWAQQLSNRVTELEASQRAINEKMGLQDRVITALGGYVDALLWWIKTGQTGPMPRPPMIVHDHLDPNLFDVDGTARRDEPPAT